MLAKIQISKVVKLCCIIFIFYIIWFKYVYGENHLILYGSVFGALGCMVMDILVSDRDFRDICPFGVTINLIMCVYSAATGIWTAINSEYLINHVKTYATFSCICIAICYVSKAEGSLDWIINTLISASLVVAVYVIFRGYSYRGYGYVLGPEHNPNNLGVFIDINLFCLAYKANKHKEKIPVYLCLTVLYVYLIVNSGSRKCLLAAAIIIGLWMFPLLRKLWNGAGVGKRMMLVCTTVLVLLGTYYYFTTQYSNTDSFQRMKLLGDEGEFSSKYRMLYYRLALDYFAERPIFGIGFYQFYFWNPYRQMSHSTYAEAIAGWGTIGTVIYFVPVIIAIVQAVRLAVRERNAYVPRILLALIAMEIFLGVGQVWFYEIEHFFAWILIYYLVDDLSKEQSQKNRMVCKYVKT